MNQSQESQRLTPGMIAVFMMGWLELATSFVLFQLEIKIVAVVFAVIATLISFLATQIRRPPWADPPSKAELSAAQSPSVIMRILPIVTAVLAVASLAGAIYQLISGEALAAILYALWTITLGIQTIRLWPHK
jgi:hypothetical protein